MTPAARIAAAIEILEQVDAAKASADKTVTAFLRARRYIGAKDRRAIGQRVFGLLRAQARLDWWCARADLAPQARHRVLAGLLLIDGEPAEAVSALFDGGRYSPPALEPGERAGLEALAGQALVHADQPAWVRLECPEWLLPGFEAAFDEDTEVELEALLGEAPLDLRANVLKGDREAARRALAEAGIEAAPTHFSPLGLRVSGRRAVTATEAFQTGLVEVQDEGSQLLALLTGARPGLAVCDLCAGAGGKTLALGAAMGGQGRLVAADIDPGRLAAAKPRLRRAGLSGVELQRLEGAEDPWLAAQAGGFDRVLVDAPCSGTGTWRRSPDARWRLAPSRLETLKATQDELLRTAAALVAPGGRLIYATCSLLPTENAVRVAAFLAAQPGFAPLPVETVWAKALGAELPTYSSHAGGLRLTPRRHGTDGFCLAILERARRLE